MLKHIHAEVLIAIAEGKPVQFLNPCGEWIDYEIHKHFSPLDFTGENLEWRVKPPEPVYEFQWIYFDKNLNRFDITGGFYTDYDSVRAELNKIEAYAERIFNIVCSFEPSRRLKK